MKTLLFYCQPILGMGQFVRSMAIAQGLTSEFKVYFVNGGAVIPGIPIPEAIEVIHLPAITTDADLRDLRAPEGFSTLNAALSYRRDRLLAICSRIQPDVLMVEGFPFGHHRFATELIPLLERARALGAKISCSLRDIIAPQRHQTRYEAKVCKLIHRYFDQLLIHGDPQLISLEQSFSRVADLDCEIGYTGYVVPHRDRDLSALTFSVKKSLVSNDFSLHRASPTDTNSSPRIVVSVGGGQLGHEMLDAVADASQLLQDKIPHQIQMFTGPFAPQMVYQRLKAIARQQPNLTVKRYTPDLLQEMAQAELSISMAGYNTTLNVLQTSVRAMLLPAPGRNAQEQRLRSHRLEDLGVVQVIRAADLTPEGMASRIITVLQRKSNPPHFHLRGVEITTARLKSLVEAPVLSCA